MTSNYTKVNDSLIHFPMFVTEIRGKTQIYDCKEVQQSVGKQTL